MIFLPAQQEALRDLRRIWASDAVVMIGASALACFMDYTWHVTRDLDFSVVASVDELDALVASLDGWVRDADQEQRWQSSEGVSVNIVPAGPEHIASGEVVWPSGVRLNLTGMRVAFETRVLVDVCADLDFPVAPVHANLLLKAIAYLDRPAERRRDLQDIAFVL